MTTPIAPWDEPTAPLIAPWDEPQQTAAASQARGALDPSDVYQYLRGKGIDHPHAIGILANIQGESGFRPGVQEVAPIRGRGGFGLFQHTGPRRAALERYMGGTNDWRRQIDFALSEPDTAPYLTAVFNSGQQAADYFVRKWERPARPDRDSAIRQRYASALQKLIAAGSPAPTWRDPTANRYAMEPRAPWET